jgi:hypothetical protein
MLWMSLEALMASKAASEVQKSECGSQLRLVTQRLSG